MTSYEFYVCKYGGKAIQPDEWQTAYADADALIRRYERLYRVEYSTDSARDTAVSNCTQNCLTKNFVSMCMTRMRNNSIEN